METLGFEAIISLALAGLTLLMTFIGHYFYVRGKLHKAAAGAITNAEQDEKTGVEKLDLAVEQVYSLVPTSLKVFIHRRTVRKIVQAAFDKIEEYAKKQVENKSGKKDKNNGSVEQIKERTDTFEEIVSPQEEYCASKNNDSDILGCQAEQENQAESEKSISWFLI